MLYEVITPEHPKASMANQEIIENQLDAQIAQKEYVELQKLHAGE